MFVDDASYNSGHGHAFDTIGINSQCTTIVVIRPDQREFISSCSRDIRMMMTKGADISLVISDQETEMLSRFFETFTTRR